MTLRIATIAAALAALAGAALAVWTAGDGSSGAGSQRLDLVVIVADDQEHSSIRRMPYLSAAEGWVRFTRAFTHQGMCCPSRATLLTGQYSHHTGVEDNALAPRFRDSETLATWLDGDGYETGLFGKYMNDFPWSRPADYVPPGWDRWVSYWGQPAEPHDYYRDVRLSIDGRVTRRRGGYSTATIARRAIRFLGSAPEPFAAFVMPYASHKPARAAPRDAGAFRGEPVRLAPNFNRGGSAFFRAQPAVSAREMRHTIRREWASLLSVDRTVAELVDALRRRGVLERTVIVYTSDNGIAHGSHRWVDKNCLYEECVHVPLLIRYPGVPGGTVRRPISNVDLAPTLAELARVEPSLHIDGQSLAPLLRGTSPQRGRGVLLRSARGQGPEGWALRTPRYKYVEYETGEVELYDLRRDPYELFNLASDPEHDRIRERLSTRLHGQLPPAASAKFEQLLGRR